MIRIAIADDSMNMLNALVSLITRKKGIQIVFTAKNGHDLIVQLQKQKELPDIIFTDIHMPVMDGMAACFYLKHHYPSIRVVGLSIYLSWPVIRQMFYSGAEGYLIRPGVESEIDIAVQSILNGEKYIDSRTEINETQRCETLQYNIGIDFSAFQLTLREKTFVMLNATALTYAEIGQTMFVAPATIQTYFDRVSKKLLVTSRQELTLFSLQNGLAKVAHY